MSRRPIGENEDGSWTLDGPDPWKKPEQPEPDAPKPDEPEPEATNEPTEKAD